MEQYNQVGKAAHKQGAINNGEHLNINYTILMINPATKLIPKHATYSLIEKNMFKGNKYEAKFFWVIDRKPNYLKGKCI